MKQHPRIVKIDTIVFDCVDSSGNIQDRKFSELLKELRPYLQQTVRRAFFYFPEDDRLDVFQELQIEVFKLLRTFGPEPMGKPFHEGVKLRVMNTITNLKNKRRMQTEDISLLDIPDVPNDTAYKKIEFVASFNVSLQATVKNIMDFPVLGVQITESEKRKLQKEYTNRIGRKAKNVQTITTVQPA